MSRTAEIDRVVPKRNDKYVTWREVRAMEPDDRFTELEYDSLVVAASAPSSAQSSPTPSYSAETPATIPRAPGG